MLAAIERTWRPFAEKKAAEYEARKTDWHSARAKSLRRKLSEHLESCGSGAVILRCARAYTAMPSKCGKDCLCERCASWRAKQLGKKAKLAVAVAYKQEVERWQREGKQRGKHPRVLLVTLTVRHSGSLDEDVGRLKQGWATWRAWLHKRLGRSVPFMVTTECTLGTRRDGHVHMHVVMVAPYFDWSDAHAAWKRATDGYGQNFDVSDTGATPRRAAEYVTKRNLAQASQRAAIYAAKRADIAGLSEEGEVFGRWLASIYGRRRVHTSQGWWVDRVSVCPCCGYPYEVVTFLRDASEVPSFVRRLSSVYGIPPPDE